ncbi:FapA family protein [Silvanigrella aquatica]|uniref:DUF342 domain-containing protein n=1 Tax=Silvanigrella aquatica TaxID=1915309 RepID=A0A1L4D011_9BACT|nr:FapA family protein [Silvanigrella aquatica]APJ03541.1 hypothetical protein AXG55_06325 [Silvanigrella aquatica]
MNSTQTAPPNTAPSPSAKKLFQLNAKPDAMQASIPARTQISPDIVKLSYEQICEYLTKLGYAVKPTQEAYEELKKCAGSNTKQFDSEFILLKGIPYSPAKPATIKWLNPPTMPKDLIRPNVPFGIIRQASEAVQAKTIFGQEIPHVQEKQEKEEKKIVTITTHPNFIIDQNGEMKCEKGGQALILPNGKIDFADVYTVKDVRPDQIQKVTFPCSVVVKCELQGNFTWIVEGDLTVEQFWTAQGITVQGNVTAKSGIQTNNSSDDSKAVRIQGNLDAIFIQSSCFIVEGNIKVEKGILASRITTSGNLECLGDPGKISGSEIIMNKGTINAKIIGSEKDKPTYIKYFAEDNANNSTVATLAEGTRIQIRKTNIIIKFDQPWPPPK